MRRFCLEIQSLSRNQIRKIISMRRSARISVLVDPKQRSLSLSKTVSEVVEPQQKRRKVSANAGEVASGAASQPARAKQARAKAPTAATKQPVGPKQSKVKAPAAGMQGLSRDLEAQQWKKGFSAVAGVDEAGRGPLAGPVVAAACIVPPNFSVDGLLVDDSKKMTAEEREQSYAVITTHSDIKWGVGCVDVETIDRINILQATMLAMELAVKGLPSPPDFILVDGNRLPKGFDSERSTAITKGDSKCFAIAAASIIAKVQRDRIMGELHAAHPQYDFATHKGYGVPAHVRAIQQHGPCIAHRRTFRPVKDWFPVEEAAEEEKQDESAASKKATGKKSSTKKKRGA